MKRLGAARGTGSGYRNLRAFPRDPAVHQQSARGIKQPQRLMHNVSGITYERLLNRIAREMSLPSSQKKEFFEKMKGYEHDPLDRTVPIYLRDIARGIKNEKIIGGLGDKKQTISNLSDDALEKLWFKHFRDLEDIPYNPSAITNEIEKRHYLRAKKGEKLVGGLGDNRPDSDFDPKELKKGIKVEMEHTNNPAIAKEIAKDHLTEDTGYYKKLAKMEGKSRNWQKQIDDPHYIKYYNPKSQKVLIVDKIEHDSEGRANYWQVSVGGSISRALISTNITSKETAEQIASVYMKKYKR